MSFRRLYKPGVELTVGGITVRNLDADGLRVAFNVTRSMTSEPDSATAAVYNLSSETRANMLAKYNAEGSARMSLRAGYDGVILPLFTGDLRRSVTTVQPAGADIPSSFSADDGGDALANARVNTASLGLTARNMVDVALAALRRAGYFIEEHPSVQAAITAAPLEARASLWESVSIGSAADLLNEAARVLGVRWFVRDEVLYFARSLLPVDGVAIELPKSHWLTFPSEDSNGVWRVTTLLDPRIVPGRQIIIVGRSRPGSRDRLRAEVCQYSGDTSAGPWRVDVTARLSA